MSLTVLCAVIFAALLHASWNALIKIGASKVATMGVLTIVQGAVGLVIALVLPFPAPEVWPWLIASGVFHAAYKVFLAFAYEQGDLSRVYPIARGAAPLIVLAASGLALSDALSGPEVLGVLILGAGILIMGRGAFTSGESRRLVPLAICSAAMTAGYSIVDGLGARVAGDATRFVAWLFVLDAAIFVPSMMVMRGRAIFTRDAKVWRLGVLAALASYGAYAIAVWAMTEAPIALVVAVRETSILFAVLIGWIVFKERMDAAKMTAALLIVLGIVVTRV